ncbi:MAG: butyrate kinase [Candidatus Omnitrophota bacterium]
MRYILVINTGNTSTKVGIFDSNKPLFVETIRHTDAELDRFTDISSQEEFREKLVMDFLKSKDIDIHDLTAVSARGGLLRPLVSGTYLVNDQMVTDLREGKRGMHASHLSAPIGYSIARKAGINCYIVDPISVDEYEPLARYTGHKLFNRESFTHALNMKAIAKRYAKENQLDYNKMIMIVVHLGTGISMALHKYGKMVDAVNPTDEGPFSPDRAGGLPIMQTVKYVTDQQMDFKTFRKKIFGDGGLYSYVGTRDFRIASEMYHQGNQEVINVIQAMAYQVAKEIGALATVNCGKVETILITGGIANQSFFVELIRERVSFLAPIVVYPGEDEMEALAEGVCRVLDNEEEVHTY